MSLWLTSFQTTELGPALARRSQWVSVPGAPLRATFSNACAIPLVHAALGSPRPPRFHTAEGTPIDGFTPVSEADSLAGKASPFGSCGPLHKRWAERDGTQAGRCVVDHSHRPGTSFRGSRLELTPTQGRYVVRVPLGIPAHTTLSAGGFGKPFPNPKPRHIPGLSSLFSGLVRALQGPPSYLSETHHLLNPLHVPAQTRTWRENTCSVNANSCS